MKQFTDSTSSLNGVNAHRAVKKAARTHSWITVIDPRNHRSLLQACDDCGVVKSENSVVRDCTSSTRQALLSGEMSIVTQIAI